MKPRLYEAARPASAAVASWRWTGLVIGLGVLLLLYLVAAIGGRDWRVRKLIAGVGGRASIAQLQWLLWTSVILFAYTALWVMRAAEGYYAPASEMPVNLLIIFGLSTGTAVAAAGIAQVGAREDRASLASALNPPRSDAPGTLFRDGSGVPDVSKIQLAAFTLAAVGILLAEFFRQVLGRPAPAGLPDLDPTLVFLVGISLCAYLTRSFVISWSPVWHASRPSVTSLGGCAWLIAFGTVLAVAREFGSSVIADAALWLFWFEALALVAFDFAWLAEGITRVRHDGRSLPGVILARTFRSVRRGKPAMRPTRTRKGAAAELRRPIVESVASLAVGAVGYGVTVTLTTGVYSLFAVAVGLGAVTVTLALAEAGTAGPLSPGLGFGTGHVDSWDPALREEPRWILAQVSEAARPERLVERAFRANTEHLVTVMIGADHPDWRRAGGGPPIDSVLPSEPGDHELVVVLVPTGGQPQSQPLLLPRSGLSEQRTFRFGTGPAGTVTELHILILHRGRVLQAASLRGRVLADPAAAASGDEIEFTLRVLRPVLSDLDRRERFDAAVVVTHPAAGEPEVIGISAEKVSLFDKGSINNAAGTISDILTMLADYPGDYAPPLDRGPNVELLLDLADQGVLLYRGIGQPLEAEQGHENLHAIQLVVSNANDFIPVELIYDLTPPAPGAALCPNWRQALADGYCDPRHHQRASQAPDLAAVVCPLGFWGLSKVIERQVIERGRPLIELQGKDFALRSEPTTGRLHLPTLAPVLFAASDRVDSVKTGLIRNVLGKLKELTGNRAQLVHSWAEWINEVKAGSPALLVLLSHTSRERTSVTLEIGAKDGRRLSQITNDLVKASPDVTPVVLLLGCDTAVAEYEYQSFAAQFLQNGAALVVGTIAAVLGEQAAPMAEDLAAALYTAAALADDGRQPGQATFAVTMRDIRRTLLGDGKLTALCLTTFGDADWRLGEDECSGSRCCPPAAATPSGSSMETRPHHTES